MKSCSDEPDETCPTIDKVIELMETIRDANSDLRERARFYEDQAGEFAQETDKALAQIKERERQLADLHRELTDLRAIVSPGE